MATYNTKIRYGGHNGRTESFHPLNLCIEVVAGETAAVQDGTTLKLAKVAAHGTLEDVQITFSDRGKRFRGSVRTGSGGPVDYWGWMVGTPEPSSTEEG